MGPQVLGKDPAGPGAPRCRLRLYACKVFISIFLLVVLWYTHNNGMSEPDLQAVSLEERGVYTPQNCTRFDRRRLPSTGAAGGPPGGKADALFAWLECFFRIIQTLINKTTAVSLCFAVDFGWGSPDTPRPAPAASLTGAGLWLEPFSVFLFFLSIYTCFLNLFRLRNFNLLLSTRRGVNRPPISRASHSVRASSPSWLLRRMHAPHPKP